MVSRLGKPWGEESQVARARLERAEAAPEKQDGRRSGSRRGIWHLRVSWVQRCYVNSSSHPERQGSAPNSAESSTHSSRLGHVKGADR